ncbi:quinoprotein relay system zinc metallohydrolase 2 [Mesorhizobium sp. ASY16-5R]|uniref:quinoprotein relay system zinc metallohydrolase 2 n=1 Tax=Mesorhizobium sp. ASY16-5R TaxID=3445772 RepID=UPI003FA0E6C5
MIRPVPIDPLRRRLVAGFACLGASAALLPCCPPRARAAGTLDLALVEIADGVFAVQGVNELMAPENRGTIANLGVVVGSEAVAVIDSGGSLVEGRALLAAIKGVTQKPIRYLIDTHMHPDHIFGNAAFRTTGATLVGHKNLPRALEARAAFYLQSYREQLGEELMRGIEIIPPTLLVEDRMDLDLGGRVIELRAWKAAHTDNDLTVFDRRTKTLFTGDLVFLQHLPTLDGSLLGWMRQMDELAAIDAAAIVPGHGPAPSPWPQALAAERRYFEVLSADLRKAIKDGVPLAEAVQTAGLSERANWALFDDYNGRNATAAYAELEWE